MKLLRKWNWACFVWLVLEEHILGTAEGQWGRRASTISALSWVINSNQGLGSLTETSYPEGYSQVRAPGAEEPPPTP